MKKELEMKTRQQIGKVVAKRYQRATKREIVLLQGKLYNMAIKKLFIIEQRSLKLNLLLNRNINAATGLKVVLSTLNNALPL
ncbi:hypothetical protein M0P98_04565 [bacterium]|nr:hypothetical protein [bacterium]